VLVEVSFIHACTFTTAKNARYRLKVNLLSLLSECACFAASHHVAALERGRSLHTEKTASGY
jgi:hypothetical protein